MSKSRWEQIEAIEALERGEGTRGREIIRVAPAVVEGDNDPSITTTTTATTQPATGAVRGGGPHQVLLQDAAGRKCRAMELKTVDGIGTGMNIGCKVLLQGAAVSRGYVLMEPETTVVLGGKVEELQRVWREGRKASLRAELKEEEELGLG